MDNQYQQPQQQQPYMQQPQQQSYYQPNYVQGGQRPPKPDNYLIWAILSTLFCCLPLGVVSIVYSSKVDGQYNAGDFGGAQDSADKAKKFAMWSAISAGIVIVIYIIIVVIAIASGYMGDMM